MTKLTFEKLYTGGWEPHFKESFNKTYDYIKEGNLDISGVIRKLEISSKRLEEKSSVLPHAYGIWSGVKDYYFMDVLEDPLATQLFIESGLLLKEKLGLWDHKNIFFDQLYSMMYGNKRFSKLILDQDQNHGLSTSAYDNYMNIISSLYRL